MTLTKYSVYRKLRQQDNNKLNSSKIDAAVAVVVSDVNDPAIILCVKSRHLRKHAGEVSLLGGKIEEMDADPMACVLRELEEETGIYLSSDSCVGSLGIYESLH